MGNLDNLAPRFTRENAAEMARRSNASRLAREAREAAEEKERDIAARARVLVGPDEDARKRRIEKQIDATIDALESCNDDEMRVKLTQALDRLWSLVYAKVGTTKPKSSLRRPAPVASETPQEPQSPPIPPAV